ncbi:MAG: DUF2512 family protein [Clostridiales bacterium]|jgi:hypothetical protein|nr:DUF2512 family protein [Clostridiales bacterium]
MKHVIALAAKFILIAVILEIVLNIMTALSFWQILMISLAVTVASYIIGDLIVLPAFGNMIASITDIGLALIIIHLFNWSGYGVIDLVDCVVAAVVTGIGELLFHSFIHAFLFPARRYDS